jgi:hypothetical protein
MTRIIKVESAGKERNQLLKAIVAALRELARQKDTGDEAYDLVSFIILSLETISNSIDVSVKAWEKRDYWVKADRFRMEWSWTGVISDKLLIALENEDWGSIAEQSAFIGQKLRKIIVSDKNRIGSPWKGFGSKLREKSKEKKKK